MITIIPIITKHVRQLSLTMRSADRRECIAGGLDPEQALSDSWDGSVYSRTALVNGKVAACWGVTGTGSTGAPWLLTGTACETVSPLAFARIYRREISVFLEYFPHLVNHVDASYTGAVRLLEICGFRLDDPQPWGSHGALFRRFELGLLSDDIRNQCGYNADTTNQRS